MTQIVPNSSPTYQIQTFKTYIWDILNTLNLVGEEMIKYMDFKSKSNMDHTHNAQTWKFIAISFMHASIDFKFINYNTILVLDYHSTLNSQNYNIKPMNS